MAQLLAADYKLGIQVNYQDSQCWSIAIAGPVGPSLPVDH